MKKVISVLVLVLLGLSFAQQKVYTPPPAPNSAFIRIIHANPDVQTLSPSLADLSFAALDYGAISTYQALAAGSYEANLAGQQATLVLESGFYYTVAVLNTGIRLMQDPSNGNLAKTMLVLYNFSDSPSVDMKTADGSTPVIGGVAGSSMANILVNPIQVDLGAFAGTASVDSFKGLSLYSGAIYSMVVMGPADALKASWALNKVAQ